MPLNTSFTASLLLNTQRIDPQKSGTGRFSLKVRKVKINFG